MLSGTARGWDCKGLQCWAMSPVAPPRPRLEDVAVAAGVSTATVSRALNLAGVVRPEVRARVLEVVQRLGYVPHAGARALTLQRSGTVGLLIPTVDNAIFAKAVDALQRRLAESGLQLLIATHDYSVEQEARQAVNLLARGVDALALCGAAQADDLLRLLAQRNTPCVHVMSLPGPPGAVSVGFDNAAAMAQAVRHLLDLRHRRFAMIAGITRDNDRAAARVVGVRAALEAAGLALPPARVLERAYTLTAGREALRELMALPQPPSALLCGNDVLAFGALLEAQRLELEVPRDLSIVGFDDLELAQHLHPGLTTLRVPAEAMWRCAGDRLVAMLCGQGVPPATEVEVALVVRGSTGPAPGRARAGRSARSASSPADAGLAASVRRR